MLINRIFGVARCAIWLCLAWLLPAQVASGQALRAQQVAPQTWMVQGESALGSSANRNFISNAAFVVTDEGVLVVDALGSPALAQALLDEIRRITPKPVRYLVVTHFHADHIYGLQVFKAAGAQIIAQRDGQAYLHSERPRCACRPAARSCFPGSTRRLCWCLPIAGWTAR